MTNVPKKQNKEEKRVKKPAFSENVFQTICDRIPGLVAVYNIQTGTYMYVNEALKKLLGYEPEEFINGGVAFVASLMHPDDVEETMRKNMAALEKSNQETSLDSTNDPIVSFEYRLRHADGHYVWLHTDGSVFSRKNGQVECVLNISIDITEHKKTMIELAKTKAKKTIELESTNIHLLAERKILLELNTAKDEFISIASHQLRTPATAVKQYLRILLDGYAGDLSLTSKQKHMLETAFKSNERQIHIIDDLLRIAQVDGGTINLNLKKTDLVQIMNDILREFSKHIDLKKQKVAFKHSAQKISVRIDGEKMRMAFENILDNASKYSPKGSEIHIVLTQTPKKTRLLIKDYGIGIKPEDHSKLFQKFSRIDNRLSTEVDGSGLGLYWVKKIIDLHGGRISVRSKPAQGTTFIITF